MSNDFAVGDRIRIVALPQYVKTAEPMPMLRPPNVISVGEEGVIIDRRPGGYWGIRFSRGAFLMESQYIELVPSGQQATNEAEKPPEASPENGLQEQQ
ncbi:MAG: DUF3148 domain-containing protein [Kastovskya adunca ATA6-11-RM4]|jgi:hypothetical protein|nr:DUF3148 domain-containing protein [Kastovskya adunca ATA6-11-RM4]